MFTSKKEALQALHNDQKKLNRIDFDALLDDGYDGCDKKQNARYAAANESLESLRYRVARYAFASITEDELNKLWKASWESIYNNLPVERYTHINKYINSLIKRLKSND